MNKKSGSVSPQQLANMGRNGDSILAHITPAEAALLKRLGGSGTINPKTGLPEFYFADEFLNIGHVFNDGGSFDAFDDFDNDNFYFDRDGGGDNHMYNYEDTGGPGGDYYSGDTGGAPTGGGATDLGINPDTGAVVLDFTGMAPGSQDTTNPGDLDFGPEAVNVPSGGVYDIFEQNPPPVVNFPDTPYTPPETPYTPLEVEPGPLPDWYTDPTTTPDNYQPDYTPPVYTGPEITVPDYTAPIIDVPPLELPELPPYIPPIEDIPDLGTIDIPGDRPVRPEEPPVVIDPIIVPPLELPELPPYIPPIEDIPDLGTIDIPGDRPIRPEEPPVVIDPIIVPPLDLPPLPPIVDPEPPLEPVVPEPEPPEPPPLPPVVEPEPPVLPPYVPPLPPVTPPPEPPPVPPVPPQPPIVNPQTGEMINPGYIQPRAFYNTTNPAQSKFFWGGHGPQFATGTGATPFNAQAYNQVAAPDTPYGLGQVAAPLSPEELQAAIEGRYQQRAGTPAATRAEAYREQTLRAPSYGQVQVGQNAPTTGPAVPGATTPTGRTRDLYTSDQKTQISNVLGANWQRDLDNAALNGDYATIVRIQNTIDSILNPVIEQA